MRNLISTLFIYFGSISIVAALAESNTDNGDFAYLIGKFTVYLGIPTFLAYFFRIPTLIIAFILAIPLSLGYLPPTAKIFDLCALTVIYFIFIALFSFIVSGLIKKCINYNNTHPSVIYAKTKSFTVNYWHKSNSSKAIMIAVPLLIVIFGYGCKVYLDKDEVLTRAATKKYNYCIQQRRWSLKTYLAAKCPEYLYYMNSCYGECKSTAIKKIKEKL